MKAYTDHERHYYLEPQVGILLVRYPNVRFALSRPKGLQDVPDEQVPRVVEGFLSIAERRGGDKLALWYIQENLNVANEKNVLVVSALAVIGKFGFENNAQEALAKGGVLEAQAKGARVLDKAQFDALSVEDRCKIARPFLNEKEATSTADGEPFAKNAWKIANRFQMPKPTAGGATAGKESKPVKEVKPREKGVKTLIRDLFTSTTATNGKDGKDYVVGDQLHLSVEEIMSATGGTKSSVSTAISDLRSTKYCGKDAQGKEIPLVLDRVNGKYSLKDSSAAKREAEAESKAATDAAAKKTADKAAADKAKADAKTAGATPAAATGTAGTQAPAVAGA